MVTPEEGRTRQHIVPDVVNEDHAAPAPGRGAAVEDPLVLPAPNQVSEDLLGLTAASEVVLGRKRKMQHVCILSTVTCENIYYYFRLLQ